MSIFNTSFNFKKLRILIKRACFNELNVSFDRLELLRNFIKVDQLKLDYTLFANKDTWEC
tara:strand:+ start:348 stop:527 length:180 start_codon:yes stop_codon:yes gene_type:complete